MGRYVSELVVDGQMTHTTLKREKGRGQYMEVLIFAGPEVGKDEKPVDEWEMPATYDYTGPAELAVRQSAAKRERKEVP